MITLARVLAFVSVGTAFYDLDRFLALMV